MYTNTLKVVSLKYNNNIAGGKCMRGAGALEAGGTLFLTFPLAAMP